MGRVSDAKDRMLEAAIKLVWRNSYGAVSVEDICSEAGVKKGSFYHFSRGRTSWWPPLFGGLWSTKSAGLRPHLFAERFRDRAASRFFHAHY